MIRFTCEHCGQSLKMQDAAAGKKGRCPGCKQILRIPAPGSAEVPVSAPSAGEEDLAAAAEQAGSAPMDASAPLGAASGHPPVEMEVLCELGEQKHKSAVVVFRDAGLTGVSGKQGEVFLEADWSQIAQVERQGQRLLDHRICVHLSDGTEALLYFDDRDTADAAYAAVAAGWPGRAVFAKHEPSRMTRAWVQLGVAGAALVIGIALYLVFAHLESEGGRIRTNVVIIAVYKTLGKTGVLLMGLAVAAVAGALGVRNLLGALAEKHRGPGR